MSLRLIFSIIVLSVFMIRGGNADVVVTVECDKIDDGWNPPYTVGEIPNEPGSSPQSKLRQDCSLKFSQCKGANNLPACLAKIINTSNQDKKFKSKIIKEN